MPVLSRAVLVGFQAAALVATVGVPLAAYAAPVPVPMPVMHIADYASQPPSRNNGTVEPQMDVLSASRRGKDVAVVNHTTSDTSSNERRQDVQDLGSLTSSLGDQSSFLSTLSAGSGNDELLSSLNSAILSLLGGLTTYQGILSDATTQKGLANYDPSNALETSLKDVINSIKYTLDMFPPMLNMDIAGLELEPIVYLVKCIVIAVLDTLENVVDGTINYGLLEELKQELQILLGQAETTRCASGIPVLGLCL